MLKIKSIVALSLSLWFTSCARQISFPAPVEETLAWHRQDLNGERLLRRHMWNVFAEITQPHPNNPNFATWEGWVPITGVNKENAFPTHGPTGRSLEVSRTASGDSQAQTPDIAPLASVYYNRDAYLHIRKFGLYDRANLTKMARTEAAIPEFPRGAVAVKPLWRVLRKDHDKSPNCIPVWDHPPDLNNSEEKKSIDTSHGRIQLADSRWFHFVAAPLPDLPHPEKIESCFLDGAGGPKVPSRTISIRDDIFGFRVDEEMATNPTNDKNLKHLEVGDWVVLMGFHITTKEVPEWTWATFYWQDQPKGDAACDQPTSKIPKRWRNYVLETSTSMGYCTVDKKFLLRPLFNPYSELQLTNGFFSNCLTCHRKSVWDPRADMAVPDTNACPSPNDVRGRMTLDFLWGLQRPIRSAK